MNGKTVAHSRAIMSQVMLPVKLIRPVMCMGRDNEDDGYHYVVAARHAHTNIVTARVDELVFHAPIYVGALVTCKVK